MARYILFVMLVAVAEAHRQQCIPEARTKGEYKKVGGCTANFTLERDKIINQSKCGEPKEVFVHLVPRVVEESVHPGAVWVKRCVGLCEYEKKGLCVPKEKIIRHIPVRIWNALSGKDACATYPVEEHVSCMCCDLDTINCETKEKNHRKCACQCPNIQEHRDCLKKRKHNMKWNRSKCTCEWRQRRRL